TELSCRPATIPNEPQLNSRLKRPQRDQRVRQEPAYSGAGMRPRGQSAMRYSGLSLVLRRSSDGGSRGHRDCVSATWRAKRSLEDGMCCEMHPKDAWWPDAPSRANLAGTEVAT